MSSSQDELDRLKQRRMAEMRRRAAEGEDEQIAQARKQQAEAQKDSLLRSILSPEARSRLQNLKMVRPEFCEQIELQLIQLAQAQRLPIPLSDDDLKRILVALQNRKRDIKITRI